MQATRNPLRSLGRIHDHASLIFLKTLIRFGAINVYQPIPEVGIKAHAKQMDVADKGLAFILGNVNGEKGSALDIGSNLGFYSRQLAQKGLFVTGVEGVFRYFWAAGVVQRRLSLNNLNFLNIFITPENISSLPTYDHVLLLNVFHHWCLAYGPEKGQAMLETLWSKSRKNLFLSFNIAPKYREKLPIPRGMDIPQWIKDFFTQRGAKEVRFLPEGRRFLVALKK